MKKYIIYYYKRNHLNDCLLNHSVYLINIINIIVLLLQLNETFITKFAITLFFSLKYKQFKFNRIKLYYY